MHYIFAAAHCLYSLMTHSRSKSFTFFFNVAVFYKVHTKKLTYVCKLFEGCLNKLQVFKLLSICFRVSVQVNQSFTGFGKRLIPLLPGGAILFLSFPLRFVITACNPGKKTHRRKTVFFWEHLHVVEHESWLSHSTQVCGKISF